MDSVKLKQLKNKDVHAQSAVASREVKEHLANFIFQRQGSSTQISNLQSSSSSSNNNNNDYSSISRVGDCSSSNSNAKSIITNQNDCYMNIGPNGVHGDNHPLRKTASMPTMHIPYKAQSLSRRRQMERRTTMSPLMKRKSRTRRQMLQSQDSNSNEYSSNPCITATSHDRSVSQSSSPATTSTISNMDYTNSNRQQQMVGSSSIASTSHQHMTSPTNKIPKSSQPIKLTSIFTNKELEKLPYDMKNSLYFSNAPNSSSSNLLQQQTANFQPTTTDKNALRQQQHLQVNEALRKTIMNRGKLGIGGSLDIDGLSGSSASSGSGAPAAGGQASDNNGGSFVKDELRQWSLDGADLKTSAALNKLALSSNVSQMAALNANLFHREYHKLHRLATTSDAASLRRSQSPSSSISMGLSGNQAAASMQLQQHPAHQAGTREPRMVIGSVHHHPHLRHYSSSSSSTSSLLSQQDSLEESSSQAIDLSSSSEASRNRQYHGGLTKQTHHHHQQPQQQQQVPGNLFNNVSASQSQAHASSQLTNHLLKKNQSNQKLLLDSFNQLQLCHSQDQIKQMLINSASTSASQQQQQQHLLLGNTSHHLHPSLLNASKNATSLDGPSCQTNLIASLAEQFNLSASAQNLLSLQDQTNLARQQQQQPHIPASEFNQWLLNCIQSKELEQSNLITSSVLDKLISLPEPYKTNLLTHLFQQQQLRSNSHAAGVNDESTKAMISRALSSPLLISSPVDAGSLLHPNNLVGAGPAIATDPHQIRLMRQALANPQQQQQQHQGMIVDSIGGNSLDETHERPGRPNSWSKSQYSMPGGQHRSLDLSAKSGDESGIFSRLNQRPINEQIDTNLFSNNPPPALNFCYTPADPKKASYSFIFNPIFDKHASTGLTYELELSNHKCICGNEYNHPENSFRILAIWRRLYDRGLMAKCARIEARRATLEEIQLCHSETYACYFGKSPYERIKLSQLDLSKLPIEGLTQLECGGQGADIDTAWNEELTPGVARLAAGCVIEAAVSVAKGKLMNAFAVVRPPGK